MSWICTIRIKVKFCVKASHSHPHSAEPAVENSILHIGPKRRAPLYCQRTKAKLNIS